MTTPESEPSLEELQADAQEAQDARLNYLDEVNPPYTEEEQARIKELTRLSLEATIRYAAAAGRSREQK